MDRRDSDKFGVFSCLVDGVLYSVFYQPGEHELGKFDLLPPDSSPNPLSNISQGAKYGYIWAAANFLCVGFFFFCMPELKGRSIESMDDLFQRSIWTMWRHAYPTEDEKVRHDVQDMLAHKNEAADAGAVGGEEKAAGVTLGQTEHREQSGDRV